MEARHTQKPKGRFKVKNLSTDKTPILSPQVLNITTPQYPTITTVLANTTVRVKKKREESFGERWLRLYGSAMENDRDETRFPGFESRVGSFLKNVAEEVRFPGYRRPSWTLDDRNGKLAQTRLRPTPIPNKIRGAQVPLP